MRWGDQPGPPGWVEPAHVAQHALARRPARLGRRPSRVASDGADGWTDVIDVAADGRRAHRDLALVAVTLVGLSRLRRAARSSGWWRPSCSAAMLLGALQVLADEARRPRRRPASRSSR